MSVICWYFDVRPLSDSSLFSLGMSVLPWEERREQVMRFRFEKDRCLCLGAGLLLAYALRQAGVTDLKLCRLANGKPVLANAPNIHFNLSHSGTIAACAVSDRPVGVDVETLQDADPGVVAMCFQPIEQEWINNANDRRRAFTRLWTRKESYLKLLGTGLTCPSASFCVLPGMDVPDGNCYSEMEEMGHLICVCTQQNNDVAFKQKRFWLNDGLAHLP